MSTSDELTAFLETRRSVRNFRQEFIPNAIIEQLVRTAAYAPSAHNKQPWRFIAVQDPGTRLRLETAFCEAFQTDMVADGLPEVDIQNRLDRTKNRIRNAPAILVVCRDATEVRAQPDESRQNAEHGMARQSVAMAGLQLLLAAHAQGLGATWICWPLFAPDAVRTSLNLPDSWDPEGMIFLGHPAEEPQTPTRIDTKTILRFK